MRKLSAAAQEERRRQVIGLRQSGMTYKAIAELVGLSPTGVLDICHRFAAEGAKGLVSKPRGRKPGEQRWLDPAQEAEVQALIRRHTPDELGLPFALWSRAAVRRWLRRDYPEVAKRAKRARGIVVWGDETGLRADDVRGRSYAPRGRTPVVRVCQTRIKLSLITAVTNKGELRWMIVDGAVNAPTFIRFLEPLIRDARCKVFLIVDRLIDPALIVLIMRRSGIADAGRWRGSAAAAWPGGAYAGPQPASAAPCRAPAPCAGPPASGPRSRLHPASGHCPEGSGL